MSTSPPDGCSEDLPHCSKLGVGLQPGVEGGGVPGLAPAGAGHGVQRAHLRGDVNNGVM